MIHKKSIAFFISYTVKLLGPKGVRWLLLGLIASTGIALVELSFSLVIQMLLTSLGLLSIPLRLSMYSIPAWSPLWAAIFLVSVGFIRFLVQLFSTQVSAFLRDYVSYRLRRQTLHQMIFAPVSEKIQSSDVNFRISELFTKSSEFVFNASLFSSMVCQTICLVGLMFFIAWKESLLGMCGIGIIGVLILRLQKKTSHYAKKVPDEQRILNESIEKISRNNLFIRLMKLGKKEFEHVQNTIQRYASHSILANFFSNLSAQTGPLLGLILLVCVMFISQNVWKTPPSGLISFVYLLVRFVQGLVILSNYLGNTIITYPQYSKALKTMEAGLDEGLQSTDELGVFGKEKKLPSSQNKSLNLEEKLKVSLAEGLPIGLKREACPSIIFQDVTFSYKGKSLFKDLNLVFPQGQQTAISGPSGSGKSTILMLLAGLLTPQKGRVIIKDQENMDYLKNIRISYVGSEPFLIKGTLLENLTYGLEYIPSEEEVYHALEQVALSSFVMEKGLNYEFLEDHSELSTGQKQRICLARAMLNEPSLLLLDEATSNLDEENQRLVTEALKQLKGVCTTIIVSHRPQIFAYADKLLTMGDFRL